MGNVSPQLRGSKTLTAVLAPQNILNPTSGPFFQAPKKSPPLPFHLRAGRPWLPLHICLSIAPSQTALIFITHNAHYAYPGYSRYIPHTESPERFPFCKASAPPLLHLPQSNQPAPHHQRMSVTRKHAGGSNQPAPHPQRMRLPLFAT